MLKKILAICMAMLMLSVTALAAPSDVAVFNAETAETTNVLTYAESAITSVTVGTTTNDVTLEKWDGQAATTAPAGAGTEASPYQISNGAELAWFANKVNTDQLDAWAVLTKDIDLNNVNWNSFGIGTSSKVYTGTFDGQGHVIYNLLDEIRNVGYTGLFHAAGAATLKNFKIENALIKSGRNNNTDRGYNAVVCGSLNGGTITNVSVSGTMNAYDNARYANDAGSFVGYMVDGTITNCYSDVNIDLSTGGTSPISFSAANSVNYGVGGIVGVNNNNSGKYSNISNCGFAGTINAPYSNRVAGIVGSTRSSRLNLSACYNTGDIIGYQQVAGIVGWVNAGTDAPATFNDLYNRGTITAKSATTSYAAGIASGVRAPAFQNGRIYSIGDVVVDDGDATTPEFNDYCALLVTAVSGNAAAYQLKGCYVAKTYGENVSKPSYTIGGVAQEKSVNLTEYNSTTHLISLALKDDKLSEKFTTDTGINGGCPIFAWQVTAPLADAQNYFVKDGSISLTLANDGYVSFDIIPFAETVTVTVGTDEKVITKAGKYTFSTGANATVNVAGAALIEIDLMNQTRPGSAIEGLESTAYKLQIPESMGGHTLIIALYSLDENRLLDCVYRENVTSVEFDLSNTNVSGCKLRAYVWENDTMTPTELTTDFYYNYYTE